MNLATVFGKTWQGVGDVSRSGQIQNQAVFAFTFCKSLESRLRNLRAIYDARLHLDQSYRPNLIICANDGEPIVIFMGDLKFKPESVTALQQSIIDLNGYTNRAVVEVLSSHDSTDKVRVSSDVEFGCFVVSDLDHETICQGIASQMFSSNELTRFHFAHGSTPQDNGSVNFHYQKPVLVGLEK